MLSYLVKTINDAANKARTSYKPPSSSSSNRTSSSRTTYKPPSTVGGAIGSIIGSIVPSPASSMMGNFIGQHIDTATQLSKARMSEAGQGGFGYNQPPATTQPITPVQPITYQVPEYKRPDYTPLIKDRFSNLRQSLLTKLRQNKEAALNQYEGSEDVVQQQGREALNNNDVERAKALQSLRAAMEASGQYGGGENVSGTVGINTTAQQNANMLKQDVGNRINEIQRARDLINTQAGEKELALEQDLNAQESEALLNAQQSADQMNFNITQDTLDRLQRQTEFGTTQNNWQKQFDTNEKWREYEAKFQEQEALWNKNPENPAVQSQVLANKASLLSNQLAELELKNYPQEQKLMLDKLKKEIAQIGSTPTMTQYDIDYKKAQLDKIKAETENLRTGSSGDPNTLAVAEAMSRGDNIVSWFDQNKLQLANDLNQSTYSKIAKMAEDKRKDKRNSASNVNSDLLKRLGLDNLFK